MSTSWPSSLESELQLTDGTQREWLSSLAAATLPSAQLQLAPEQVRDRLARLGADEQDVVDLLRLLPQTERPGTRWAIARCRDQLVNGLGETGRGPAWPGLPGEFGRHFYVYVFLAAIPEIREFHAARGIDEDVSWASLGDMAQQMRVHRRIFGAGGLHTQEWLKLPYRGLLYSLGRLQFNFSRYGSEARPGLPFAEGDLLLGTHIPEIGPLDAAECERSFARAAEFFAKHFPEAPVSHTVCHSWLLDPQLADYLRPETNIVRFQRMFTAIDDGRTGDRDVLEFVFRRVGDVDLDTLPQDTTLQRAVVSHLRSGRHWQVRSGWRAL